MAKLEDTFVFIRNGASIKQGEDDTGYPITRIETISDRVVNREKMGYAGITDIEKYKDYVLQDGDILMSHINSEIHLGKSALYRKQGEEVIIHGMNLLCLRPNYELLDSAFVNYYFNSNAFIYQIPNITKKSVNQASFSVSALKKLNIPTPSLETQRQIAANLDKVTHAIDLCNAILEKLDLLVKSRFVEMFGDPITNPKGWKMVDLGELTSVGSSKRIFEKEYVESGIPFYRTKEIVELSKGNPITTELFISEKRYAEIKKQYGVPKKGDLLISAVGTIGVIWIVDGENDFYFKDGNLIQVDGTNRFNSSYMKWLLEYLIAEYKKQMSAGTAYAALTISGLSKMQVYDVPIDLQQQFAAFVEQTDKSKSAVKQVLEKAETLKKALMQEYFG